MSQQRRPTSTSAFGVGRRENHDATNFYGRFIPPALSKDSEVCSSDVLNQIFWSDSRSMPEIPDKSVALVVTSPPYFAGKEYEANVGEGIVPADYIEYLELLRDVFAECVRKLEPGGRLAVNVANLGRKPYRSLSADVIGILQNDLALLLRGEIVWQKASGANGSCAWGSFQNSSNPVLRDLTERIIIASKGRFDRAVPRRERAKRGLPSDVSISKDEFMEATMDVWEIPPESATKVGHPAPFPVELPLRLIHLYTYREDLVLDPFMGSGSTAIAAIRSDRRFVGYETDETYVRDSLERVSREYKALQTGRQGRLDLRSVVIPAVRDQSIPEGDFQARAVREGQKAKEIAKIILKECGFRDPIENYRFRNGVEANFVASDARGKRWYFDVSGAFSSTRAGLRRTDTIWKALGKAAVLKVSEGKELLRFVLLSTDLPPKPSAGWTALQSARGNIIFDAIEMLSDKGQDRLRTYAKGDHAVPIGELLPED